MAPRESPAGGLRRLALRHVLILKGLSSVSGQAYGGGDDGAVTSVPDLDSSRRGLAG